MRKLILIAVLIVLLALAASPQPQITHTVSVTEVNVSSVNKIARYDIKFYNDGVLVAFTRVSANVTWYAKCVKVNSSTKGHWVKADWGKWTWIAWDLGATDCLKYRVGYAYDKWISPPGYADHTTYIGYTVNWDQPGKMHWQSQVW